MKDESKANQFDEAANKAADDICDNVWIPDNEIPQFQERIAKHHADLRATYEKLVELVKLYKQKQAVSEGLHNASLTDGIRRASDALQVNQMISMIESNPLVQSAIERSK